MAEPCIQLDTWLSHLSLLFLIMVSTVLILSIVFIVVFLYFSLTDMLQNDSQTTHNKTQVLQQRGAYKSVGAIAVLNILSLIDSFFSSEIQVRLEQQSMHVELIPV